MSKSLKTALLISMVATLFFSGCLRTKEEGTPISTPSPQSQTDLNQINPSINPEISVENQDVKNDTVLVKKIVSPSAGWIVIYSYNTDDKKPSLLIGFSEIKEGTNENIPVTIVTKDATPTLVAMLHQDTGEPGQFEYPDKDEPLLIQGKNISQTFDVKLPKNKIKVSSEVIPNTKVFNIAVQKTKYSPSEITVNQNDTVKINVTSPSFDTSIAIAGYGINETIKAGETKTIEFTADKTGNFSFFCSASCDNFEKSPMGTLVVK